MEKKTSSEFLDLTREHTNAAISKVGVYPDPTHAIAQIGELMKGHNEIELTLRTLLNYVSALHLRLLVLEKELDLTGLD